MKRAELIVTKLGGITLFEAINSKTPIYVLCPFLSQEHDGRGKNEAPLRTISALKTVIPIF